MYPEKQVLLCTNASGAIAVANSGLNLKRERKERKQEIRFY